MQNAASATLAWASFFLAIVAMILNSPALFFMATALIATILAAKLQAYLAVRGLRIQRYVANEVQQGSMVTVELTVASERHLKRPLVRLIDQLPKRYEGKLERNAVAVAPDYGRPIRTRYQFLAGRRGVLTWSTIKVISTDALGLTSAQTTYELEPSVVTVLPAPIAFEANLSFGVGGSTEGGPISQRAATGIAVRNLRPYVSGDPLRHIHWRSSARSGTLLVKEFETDSDVRATIFLPLASGDDLVDQHGSALDDVIGYALYLAERLVWSGAEVWFPGLESGPPSGGQSPDARIRQVQRLLARAEAGDLPVMGSVIQQTDPNLLGKPYIFVTKPSDTLGRALVQAGVLAEVFVLDSKEWSRPFAENDSAQSPAFVSSLERSGARIHRLARSVQA